MLRGLPGSGKSSLAQVLSHQRHPVFSVDDYFTDENGHYHFDHLKNHLAYKSCEERTAKAMQRDEQLIILDNTFTIEWEIEPYFKLAAEHGYRVHVVTVENRHQGKNIHHIPEEQIEKMRLKYKLKL